MGRVRPHGSFDARLACCVEGVLGVDARLLHPCRLPPRFVLLGAYGEQAGLLQESPRRGAPSLLARNIVHRAVDASALPSRRRLGSCGWFRIVRPLEPWSSRRGYRARHLRRPVGLCGRGTSSWTDGLALGPRDDLLGLHGRRLVVQQRLLLLPPLLPGPPQDEQFLRGQSPPFGHVLHLASRCRLDVSHRFQLRRMDVGTYTGRLRRPHAWRIRS
mmetsp:Transcript_102546/g.289612  ORF Transcript_102546/g.289612 Transcript_102546/m.289612 type:complete len:216 (-) Transcript_102546:1083-1730(-)